MRGHQATESPESSTEEGFAITSNIYKGVAVNGSDEYFSFGTAVDALKNDIAQTCPEFDLSVKSMRRIEEWEVPAWRNALVIFKVEKSRYEAKGEAMENPGAYLMSLVKRARAGKLTTPNLTDAEGKIVEPMGDPERLCRRVFAHYGFWDLEHPRPLGGITLGEIVALKAKLMPLVRNRKWSEVEKWCSRFDQSQPPGQFPTPRDNYVRLLAYVS